MMAGGSLAPDSFVVSGHSCENNSTQSSPTRAVYHGANAFIDEMRTNAAAAR